MTQPAIFFAEVNERQGGFHRRAIRLGGFAGLGITALGARLAYLQLFETQRFEKLATSNQFNFKLAPAPRGVIVDRSGAVLAANRPNFRLMVARDKGLDTEATLKTLANFVPLDEARQRRLLRDINTAPKRAPVSVMRTRTGGRFRPSNVPLPDRPAGGPARTRSRSTPTVARCATTRTATSRRCPARRCSSPWTSTSRTGRWRCSARRAA